MRVALLRFSVDVALELTTFRVLPDFCGEGLEVSDSHHNQPCDDLVADNSREVWWYVGWDKNTGYSAGQGFRRELRTQK